ncbi:MAG TPA: glycosyltransferase family 9 protein, partial [Candidatus Saccharimonadales bacterium]|nr:glycosyltransferase family 9 protein [Candidatus Saccharimonadales bacterium]
LSLQMQGDGSIVNPLVELFKAHQTAGFFRPGDYCPDAERFLPYPDTIHEVRRHLRLMEFLDIPLQGEELEFPTKPADTARLKRLQHKYGLQSHRYIVVHPGAISARPWPPAAFAKVADALAPAGWQIVLTGTASEQTITARVAAKMKHPVIDLAGVTDLGSLAALIRDAALLVANDTGVSHVAAATRTPSVIIVTTSDPARWAPLDRLLHRPVLQPAPADWQSVVAAAVQLLS